MHIIKPNPTQTLPESRKNGKYIINYIRLPRQPPARDSPRAFGILCVSIKRYSINKKNAKMLKIDCRHRFPKENNWRNYTTSDDDGMTMLPKQNEFQRCSA